MVASAYIPRRKVKAYGQDTSATFERLYDDLSAFAVPSLNTIVLSRFASTDDLAVLLHENNHVKSLPFFSKEEIEESEKFFDLISHIMKSDKPIEAMQKVRANLGNGGYMNEIKRWSQSYFLEEKVANEGVKNYFVDHADQLLMGESRYYRLLKLLNFVTLSYRTMINNIFGEDIIVAELVEYIDY